MNLENFEMWEREGDVVVEVYLHEFHLKVERNVPIWLLLEFLVWIYNQNLLDFENKGFQNKQKNVYYQDLVLNNW